MNQQSLFDAASEGHANEEAKQRSAPDSDPRLLDSRRRYLDAYWQARGYCYNPETFEYEWLDS